MFLFIRFCLILFELASTNRNGQIKLINFHFINTKKFITKLFNQTAIIFLAIRYTIYITCKHLLLGINNTGDIKESMTCYT